MSVSVLLAGCNEVKEQTNRGGDTTCGEFRAQSGDDQRITVTKFLREQGGADDTTPAPLAVDAAITAVAALCAVNGNDQTAIRNAQILPGTVPK